MYKIIQNTIFATIIVLTFFSITTSAQNSSYRLRDLADKLQRNANGTAENVYRDFARRSSNSRSDTDNLIYLQQIKATSEIFQRLVNDNRSNSELRDVASSLSDLSRKVSGFYSSEWRQTQTNIDDISREIGNSGYSSGGNRNDDRQSDTVIGRVRWRGTVDDEVNLVIRAGSLEVRTISGSPFPSGNFNFTSDLPNRKVNVAFNKKKGRGSVSVIQEPSRENNYTAVIQIRDKDSGAKDYDLDIYWTR